MGLKTFDDQQQILLLYLYKFLMRTINLRILEKVNKLESIQSNFTTFWKNCNKIRKESAEMGFQFAPSNKCFNNG